MRECTRRVLRTFRASGVEPIVESKVRTAAELQDLGHLIQDGALEAQSEEPPGAPVPARPGPAEAPGVPASWAGLREALGLKDVARAGWLRRGVEAPESVAAHSWGVAFLASQLCPASLDRGRVLEMSIVHDLAEVRVGDITPRDGVPPAEKHRLEAQGQRSSTQAQHSSVAAGGGGGGAAALQCSRGLQALPGKLCDK
ncbi:unnamed protein product [Prorocentrum cordatum]|uniref:HD domain-containing protein n=1 Tax=Prorocentrum cordatum TaxID=2364126 RepID=A0ABN9XLP8_9DINO|nr:unnamed protein product [Polarella glacialis]